MKGAADGRRGEEDSDCLMSAAPGPHSVPRSNLGRRRRRGMGVATDGGSGAVWMEESGSAAVASFSLELLFLHHSPFLLFLFSLFHPLCTNVNTGGKMPAASASLVIRDGGGSGVRPPAHWRRREEEEEADASSSTIT